MSVPGEFTDEPSSHTTLNGFISRPPLFSLGARPITSGVAPSDIIEALSSSEDGIKKSLVIDMKGLVGDAVGNVCHTSYASSFPHWKVDEHRPLIPRLGPCCVRPSLTLSFPRGLTFHLIKAQWPLHHRSQGTIRCSPLPSPGRHMGRCRCTMEPTPRSCRVHYLYIK